MAEHEESADSFHEGGSEVILTLHRSILSLLGGILLFAALTVLICTLSYYLVTPESSSSTTYFVRVLAVLPALVLLEVLRRYFNDLWVVKTDVIEHHKGRIALSYSVPVIDYADIREVMTSQKLYARILGFGDVFIGTAAHEGWEMVIHGVADPKRIQQMIDDLRRRREKAKALSTDDKAND